MCAVLAFLLLCFSGTAKAFTLSAEEEAALDTAVREAHIPAMAVLIVDPEGVVFERTWGDVTRDTPFLLGSLSKSFTAFCIMQLAEKGRIDPDAEAVTYLETAPPGVTVRQLLNQTGGIGPYQTPGSEKPVFPAGQHIYSNLNYALLGQIVEAVSGLSYEEYLQTNVLEPLGMKNTSSDAEKAHENSLVQGYANCFGLPVPAPAHFPDSLDWIQPAAGYISSSAADMGRYLQMYLRGGERLLAEENVQRMFEENVPVEEDIPYGYGMGWTVMRDPLPRTVYRHSGLVETGMTCMYLVPDMQLGIIFLANMNDYLVGTDLMDRLGWNLVLSVMGETPGQLSPGEYWPRHAAYNVLCACVAATAFLALILYLYRRQKPGHARRIWPAIVLLCASALLLGSMDMFLETPLWVVAGFAPDIYLTLILSAAVLAAVGILHLTDWSRLRRERSAYSASRAC